LGKTNTGKPGCYVKAISGGAGIIFGWRKIISGVAASSPDLLILAEPVIDLFQPYPAITLPQSW